MFLRLLEYSVCHILLADIWKVCPVVKILLLIVCSRVHDVLLAGLSTASAALCPETEAAANAIVRQQIHMSV